MKEIKAKKRLMVISALMLSCIIAIGLCSINYAIWTNELVVETKISTGWLDVNFSDNGRKNIDDLELKPFETVRVWISDDSSIPSRYAGIKNEKELQEMGIAVEHGESSNREYLDITLEKEDFSNPEQTYEINILYEQENSPQMGGRMQ